MSEAFPNTGGSLPSAESAMPSAERPATMLKHHGDGLAVISPAQHAVLDYAVAGTFLAMGSWLSGRHRPAAQLAFLNAAIGAFLRDAA